ncbi:hypothetical protein A6S26_19200 [Nostoc sp. ATCC 43529]|nr:hypothetical protein A6S26_19200 [Nostoc sp. ATCC 43529]
MDKLGVGNNNNLFELVKFLKNYHSPNTADNQKDHRIYNIYKKNIISKINNKFYKKNVEDKSTKFSLELISKIPECLPMIDNFINLPPFEQRNVNYLAWFILYCQTYQFNDESDYNHKILKCYSDLIKYIKSLPIYE